MYGIVELSLRVLSGKWMAKDTKLGIVRLRRSMRTLRPVLSTAAKWCERSEQVPSGLCSNLQSRKPCLALTHRGQSSTPSANEVTGSEEQSIRGSDVGCSQSMQLTWRLRTSHRPTRRPPLDHAACEALAVVRAAPGACSMAEGTTQEVEVRRRRSPVHRVCSPALGNVLSARSLGR